MDLSTISSMLTKQTQAVSLFVLIKIRAFHMYYSTICFSHLTALRVNSYRSRKSAFSNIQLCSPECPKGTQWGPDHEGAQSSGGTDRHIPPGMPQTRWDTSVAEDPTTSAPEKG